MGFGDVMSRTDDGSHLDREQRRGKGPIAAIAMGVRFPARAHDPESLWDPLSSGTDPVSGVPSTRWDVDEPYDPDPGALGKTYSR